MNIAELMKLFGNPETIKSLGMGDKMMGVGVTVILGMGITVIALIFIQFMIGFMTSMLAEKPKTAAESTPGPTKTQAAPVQEEVPATNDEELVAVIAAAVAAHLGTSTGNLLIKNIRKVADATPTWGKAGIVDQMSTRF
ncbi:OadG family transporter subunit [uncultured Ilyobacter sp.]|uniref:OadG family transporter subunit n=1 Tax=uncultured Ilyobacter sp. TaxID=544433 RepID=UPI0029F57967|nr:OadG family transporter subunit [uncultured Ilyobacter sp.]